MSELITINETAQKRNLVLLSGGLDSTYLAYTLLQIEDIDVLYVSGTQGKDKIAAEEQALEKIYQWFEKHSKFKIVNKLKVDVSGLLHDHSVMMFSQPNQWIIAALNIYGPEHKSVMISYVCGDQIASHVPQIEDAWESLVKFTKIKHIPLRFPLIYERKASFFKNIPASLRKLTWSCEIPKTLPSGKFKECGKCVACTTSRIQKFAAKFTNEEIDKLIKNSKKV